MNSPAILTLQLVPARVCGNEYWYQDGRPCWKNAPSAEDAAKEKLNLVKSLRWHGEELNLTLASRVKDCTPTWRCQSSACPECSRAFQRWFVDRAKSFICHRSTAQLVLLSLVDGDDAVSSLSTKTLNGFNEKTIRKLNQLSIAWALGGVDISYNIDIDESAVWQPHAFVITQTRDFTRLRKELQKLYPSSRSVPRPIRIRPFDGAIEGVSYSFKTRFVQRVRFIGAGKVNRVRSLALKSRQRHGLLNMLHDSGLHSRLLIHGLAIFDTDRVPTFR